MFYLIGTSLTQICFNNAPGVCGFLCRATDPIAPLGSGRVTQPTRISRSPSFLDELLSSVRRRKFYMLAVHPPPPPPPTSTSNYSVGAMAYTISNCITSWNVLNEIERLITI